MSTAYVSKDRPNNKLGCSAVELRTDIRPESISRIKDLRAECKRKYQVAGALIRDTAKNNRLKHKAVDFDILVQKDKEYFNYMALDFYLYCIGYEPDSHDMYKEGIEYEMRRLASELESMLHTLGMYKGYNSIHWSYGDGCEEWLKAGEPDWGEGKEAYNREELGNYYY